MLDYCVTCLSSWKVELFPIFHRLTPSRGTERYCSLGPRPISLLSFLTPSRGTELYCSLGQRPISLLFFFFLTPPRGAERHRSLGPRPILFFFNATPRHRATVLSRSAIARVASVSVRFRSKERGNGASKEREGGTPCTERHRSWTATDAFFFITYCHRVAQQRHSFSPRPKRYLVSSLL